MWGGDVAGCLEIADWKSKIIYALKIKSNLTGFEIKPLQKKCPTIQSFILDLVLRIGLVILEKLSTSDVEFLPYRWI